MKREVSIPGVEVPDTIDPVAPTPETGARGLLRAIVESALRETLLVAKGNGQGHGDCSTPERRRRMQANAQWWWFDDLRDETVYGSAAFICNELGLDLDELRRGVRAKCGAALMDADTRQRLGGGWLFRWEREDRDASDPASVGIPVSAGGGRGAGHFGMSLWPASQAAPAVDWSWDAIVKRDILAEIRAEAWGIDVESTYESIDERRWVRAAAVSMLDRIIRAAADAHTLGFAAVADGTPLRSHQTQMRRAKARALVMLIAVSADVPVDEIRATLAIDPAQITAAARWLFAYQQPIRMGVRLVARLVHDGVLASDVLARWEQAQAALDAVPQIEWARRKSRRTYWLHREEHLACSRAWHEENREAHRAYQSEKYHALKDDPAFREARRRARQRERERRGDAVRARARAWYAANKVRVQAERRAQLTEADRVKIRAKVKAWRLANPERVKANARRAWERERARRAARKAEAETLGERVAA